jgi:hypothetical protein
MLSDRNRNHCPTEPGMLSDRNWNRCPTETGIRIFHAFAILHGKLFRLGRVTLQELRKRIYRSLLCGWPRRFFSG